MPRLNSEGAPCTSLLPALVLAVLCGCDNGGGKGGKPAGPKPEPKLPTDVVLTFDGVTFTRGDVEPLVAYYKSLDPTLGHNKTVREILEQHLIPMAFIRRDYAEQWEQQRKLAEQLAGALGKGGYDDLVEQAKRLPGYKVDTGLIREHLAIREQQWLFDDLKIGAISPVLDSPFGYSIVAANAKTPGPTTAYDKVDACLVRFHVLTKADFIPWYNALKSRHRQDPKKHRAVVSHEFRDAVPPWMQPTIED